MTQQERSVRTRRAIVEAAGAIFAEKGFNGATIADVYTRLGLTKGAFYYYFDSKEMLAQAVVDSQLYEDGNYPLVPRDSRLQELVDAGMVFAHRIRRDPMVQGGIRLSIEHGLDEACRRKPFAAWLDHDRQALVDAKAHGELQPHVEPADVAMLFVGAFSGVQLLSEVMAGRVDLERRISIMLQYVMPSLAVPSILAKLDLGADRGARVLRELEELADLERLDGARLPVGRQEAAAS
ncbi:ScbR family autoregulator-binding transcription factor [Streptomyces sp. NPDC047928]|uniref:ScbR family autoregulator-binding transcription factor n=1 Tax=unclassified Streptomyces TaxID=2593676 RepID=UPI003713158E